MLMTDSLWFITYGGDKKLIVVLNSIKILYKQVWLVTSVTNIIRQNVILVIAFRYW